MSVRERRRCERRRCEEAWWKTRNTSEVITASRMASMKLSPYCGVKKTAKLRHLEALSGLKCREVGSR